ncbi:MAG: hypothetical protein J6B94_07220, partial [Lachnospiraceae bacterium]|nr:hypothetical protein [Lachnospiraceae bacterium]
ALYTIFRHSNSYVFFSYPFFFNFDNIYFSKFIAKVAGYNHSGFREIIYPLGKKKVEENIAVLKQRHER